MQNCIVRFVVCGSDNYGVFTLDREQSTLSRFDQDCFKCCCNICWVFCRAKYYGVDLMNAYCPICTTKHKVMLMKLQKDTYECGCGCGVRYGQVGTQYRTVRSTVQQVGTYAVPYMYFQTP